MIPPGVSLLKMLNVPCVACFLVKLVFTTLGAQVVRHRE